MTMCPSWCPPEPVKEPESETNHEFGKWCYMMDRHCETAIIPVNDCMLCFRENKSKKEGEVDRR